MCALVTGVQTCALPICRSLSFSMVASCVIPKIGRTWGANRLLSFRAFLLLPRHAERTASEEILSFHATGAMQDGVAQLDLDGADRDAVARRQFPMARFAVETLYEDKIGRAHV